MAVDCSGPNRTWSAMFARLCGLDMSPRLRQQRRRRSRASRAPCPPSWEQLSPVGVETSHSLRARLQPALCLVSVLQHLLHHPLPRRSRVLRFLEPTRLRSPFSAAALPPSMLRAAQVLLPRALPRASVERPAKVPPPQLCQSHCLGILGRYRLQQWRHHRQADRTLLDAARVSTLRIRVRSSFPCRTYKVAWHSWEWLV